MEDDNFPWSYLMVQLPWTDLWKTHLTKPLGPFMGVNQMWTERYGHAPKSQCVVFLNAPKRHLWGKKSLIVLWFSSSLLPNFYLCINKFNNISLPWALAHFYYITFFGLSHHKTVGTCFWGLDNWIVTLDGSLLTRWTTNMITWITILNTLVEMCRVAHNVLGSFLELVSSFDWYLCYWLVRTFFSNKYIICIIYICWHTCFIFILKCAQIWLGSLRVVLNYGEEVKLLVKNFRPWGRYLRQYGVQNGQ